MTTLLTVLVSMLIVVVAGHLLLTVGLIRQVANLSAGGVARPRPNGHIDEGAPAPAVSIRSADGQPILTEIDKMAPGVLGIFTDSCADCIEHAPDFLTIAAHQNRRGRQATAVVFGELEDGSPLDGLVSAAEVRVLNPGPDDTAFADDWQVRSVPWYYAIDADGTIARSTPYIDELVDYVDETSGRLKSA